MALTTNEVLNALRNVFEPYTNRSIVDLDLLEDVRVEETGVTVRIALPVARESLASELSRRIGDVAQQIDGVGQLKVDVAIMSDEQVEKLREKLRPRKRTTTHDGHEHEGEKHQGHEHGSPKENPFIAAESKTRILGISSGKGGVGKSSVTVNLAVALAKRGHNVAIIDADVYGFSIPKMLGVNEEPLLISDLIVPPIVHGVHCISIGFFVQEDQPVMWRGPMLHKALEQFLTDVYWPDPDYLLIDMPPGTGDVALSMAQYLPRSEIFVVTTPQAASQRVAQRTAYMAKQVNLPLAGVIENMSWFTGDDGKRYEIFGSGGGENLATQLEIPLMGRVPLVQELRNGGDIGVPITVSNPEAEASMAFFAIAEQVETMGTRRIYRSELKLTS